MEYRGYSIQPDSLVGYTYAHKDYDGACGVGWTLKGCLDAIDDIIADQLFCEKCDSTGIYHLEGFKEECECCSQIREDLGEAKNYPEKCLLCDSQMKELYPGSGKENLRCSDPNCGK